MKTIKHICLLILLTTCLGCTVDRTFVPGQGHLHRVDAPDVPGWGRTGGSCSTGASPP